MKHNHKHNFLNFGNGVKFHTDINEFNILVLIQGASILSVKNLITANQIIIAIRGLTSLQL